MKMGLRGDLATRRSDRAIYLAPGVSHLAYLVNRRQIAIEWGHCDPSGILLNSRYFEFSDWSTALLFQAAVGMNKSELMAKYDANMPLVDVRGRFVKTLKLADLVEIASTIREFRRSSFDVTHQFLKDGEVAAETQETRVWCTIDSENPPNLKSLPVPPELVDRFRIS
jgi:4-hydroxybenzoyl-CoA thioesterase